MLLVLYKKFLGKRQSSHQTSTSLEPIEQIVIQIQTGDLNKRNQLITDYQPYVAKMTSRFCKRYIDPARDDEFSIALSAFNEAISQFSSEAGRSFLGFAETVVRRRLIDYVRKQQRFSQQVPYSSFDYEDDEEHIVSPIEVNQAMKQYDEQLRIDRRRDEIIDLDHTLSGYGIRFSDLVDSSPKHSDSRIVLFTIGKLISDDPLLMKLLLTKKLLPIKELLEQVLVSRKTLERNRKFLIAVALIYDGNYPYLKEYLNIEQPPSERSENDE